jgi:hypothetical protein
MFVYMSFVTYELSGHPDHDDRAFHELPDRVQEIHDTHAILETIHQDLYQTFLLHF